MATIGGLDVPNELIELFKQLVRISDNNRYGSVAQNGHLLSRAQRVNISTRSLLPQIGAMWDSLTVEQKNAWKAAAAVSHYNAWNLFVQDTAYRLKHDIAGIATPNLFYQYKVGRIEINAPATRVKIAQYHPPYFYKARKVTGSKGLYEDIKISEKLQLPLTIGCSYKSQLTSVGAGAYAKMYALVKSSYQGRTIETEAAINFNLNQDWTSEDFILSEVIGVARSYDLYIDIYNCRGAFMWDNTRAEHSGSNYARDTRNNDVNNEPSRVNWQIEKSWQEEILPVGAAYDSIYLE